MKILEIYKVSLNDFFSKQILALAILPIIGGVVFWAILFYIAHEVFGNEIFWALRVDNDFVGDFSWVQEILDRIVRFLIYIVSFVLPFLFAYLGNLIICAFLSEPIAKIIAARNFVLIDSIESKKEIESNAKSALLDSMNAESKSAQNSQNSQKLKLEGDTSLFRSLWQLVKHYALWVVLICAFLPVYFVPILGAFAFIVPNYLLFYWRLVVDMGECVLDRASFVFFEIKQKWFLRRAILPLFVLNFVPILNFFVPIFSLVVSAHIFLRELAKMRGFEFRNKH